MTLVAPALLLTLLLAGCATPRLPHEKSEAIPAGESAFGRSIQAAAAQQEGRSGFRLLPNSSEAFRARAELIRNAQKSLDVQYYIVHNGLSTRALVRELLLAADRGVRIRVLLDDTASDGQEEVIATLAVHPNIHVRVFNPLHLGRSTLVTRTMGRLLNLSQQHRRMHNKLWLADNSAAIVGGRNLGDEYFDAKPDLNFTDMDLLCLGPVAEQLGHSFDQYWNSALSQAISDFLIIKPTAEDLQESRQRLEQSLQAMRIENQALYDHLMTYRTHPQLATWRQQLIWAHGTAMWDAPSKVLADDEPARSLLMATQLRPELDAVHKELILISAYFVPQTSGMRYLLGRADAGVDVRLLTNSLEATDVPAVHGGYAPSISIRAQCCGTLKSGCWSTALNWPATCASWRLRAWRPRSVTRLAWKTVRSSGSQRTTVACMCCARSPAAHGAASRPGSATRSAWRKCSRPSMPPTLWGRLYRLSLKLPLQRIFWNTCVSGQ
jgi:putative cardiolipin synthase